MCLHLTLELLEQGLEFVHIGCLSGPFDSETFCLVWLGNLCITSATNPHYKLNRLKSSRIHTTWTWTYQIVSFFFLVRYHDRRVKGTNVFNLLMRSTAIVL